MTRSSLGIWKIRGSTRAGCGRGWLNSGDGFGLGSTFIMYFVGASFAELSRFSSI